MRTVASYTIRRASIMNAGRACSSVAEHGAHNPRVAGSNPAGLTRPQMKERTNGVRPIETTQTQDQRVAASRVLALEIADVLTDTPAAETVVLDISRRSSFCDFFVICSGENERQLRAITTAVRTKMSEREVHPRRSEGEPASGWMVVDYGDVIVHIFSAGERSFYQLEDLWSDAITVVAIQ
jgi:ribosome-associated protein